MVCKEVADARGQFGCSTRELAHCEVPCTPVFLVTSSKVKIPDISVAFPHTHSSDMENLGMFRLSLSLSLCVCWCKKENHHTEKLAGSVMADMAAKAIQSFHVCVCVYTPTFVRQ